MAVEMAGYTRIIVGLVLFLSIANLCVCRTRSRSSRRSLDFEGKFGGSESPNYEEFEEKLGGKPFKFGCSDCGATCVPACGTRKFPICCMFYVRKRDGGVSQDSPASKMSRPGGATPPTAVVTNHPPILIVQEDDGGEISSGFFY